MGRTAALLAIFLAGCSLEGRGLVGVQIVAGGTGITELTTVDGDTVLLDEARVTFVDLRLEEPPSTDLAAVLYPIASAWAHPGHDAAGDVSGELLGTFTVDLLAAATEIGHATCYEGTYATGRVRVEGAFLELAGTWISADGTDERPFRFEVEADQDIVGIPFEAEIRAEDLPSHVALRFDPAGALAHVVWPGEDTDGDGVITTADAEHDHTTRFGAVATPTWSLEAVR